MKLVYGPTKDIGDLERMFATLDLDVAYVREWITKLPEAVTKLRILDDLVRRFRSAQ
jgi:hypothetical protein